MKRYESDAFFMFVLLLESYNILLAYFIYVVSILLAYTKHTLSILYLCFIYALSILYQCYIYAIYTLYVLSIFLVSITFFYWILLLSRLRSNWQYWSFWNSIFFLWLSWLRWTWQDLELIWWVLDFARIDRVWSCFGSTVLDTFCNSKSLAFLLQNTWSDGGGKSVLQFSTSLELTIWEFLGLYIYFVYLYHYKPFKFCICHEEFAYWEDFSPWCLSHWGVFW